MLHTTNLTKQYKKAGQTINALDRVDLQIEQGDFVVIHGHSGSGKSTLLLILGGMLHPSGGNVMFNDKNLYSLSPFFRMRYRKQTVGFMFQKFYLMPYLTIQDNIRLPLAIQNANHNPAERIQSLAEFLGIQDRLRHLPEELSVGEQQRAAMARTLAGQPQLILADEPTGNLDAKNRAIIAECLQQENEQGKTIILATHDETLMNLGTKTYELQAGRMRQLG
ncbi:ATP-binding cassette domain-containing protein [bacterium]|nr:ATP-binding cassette domain-containing protein [bacterium]